MADITYTEGNLVLAKIPYNHPRGSWHTPFNQTMDRIAALGQTDTDKGAALVGIPTDTQSDFGGAATLKDVLAFIVANYMHSTGGSISSQAFDQIVLNDAVARLYRAKENISQYQCVYVSEDRTTIEDGIPYISPSSMGDGSTLPAIGMALSSIDEGETGYVAIMGHIENPSWSLSLSSVTGVPSHKYVFVGQYGYIEQWGVPPYEPPFGIQVVGYVETPTSIFLRPDLTWSQIDE